MQIFVGVDPIYFRCGIDKLSIISESLSKFSSLSGTVFVFETKGKTAVKSLVHETRINKRHKTVGNPLFSDGLAM